LAVKGLCFFAGMKMLAPDAQFAVYSLVLQQTILTTRKIAKIASASSASSEEKQLALEQIFDLQDAIHIVIECLNQWERCDEQALHATFFAAYDKKWLKQRPLVPFSFKEAFRQAPP
jgi:hypothetical protein